MANTGDVDVVFRTREKGRYFLKTTTEMGNGEGNAVCVLQYNIIHFLMSHRASLGEPEMHSGSGNPRS